MTEPELKADKRKRRRFSAMVAMLSVLIAISLYLGITNALQQDSNTGRIGKLEQPSGPELASRLKLGIEECLKRASCLTVFAKVNRAGRAVTNRRNGGAARTPAATAPGNAGPGTGGQNGGSTPSQPAPTPRPPPSHPAPTRPPPEPAPTRPQVHLPPPLPTVTLPGPVCVPDPLHAGQRICTP